MRLTNFLLRVVRVLLGAFLRPLLRWSVALIQQSSAYRLSWAYHVATCLRWVQLHCRHLQSLPGPLVCLNDWEAFLSSAHNIWPLYVKISLHSAVALRSSRQQASQWVVALQSIGVVALAASLPLPQRLFACYQCGFETFSAKGLVGHATRAHGHGPTCMGG